MYQFLYLINRFNRQKNRLVVWNNRLLKPWSDAALKRTVFWSLGAGYLHWVRGQAAPGWCPPRSFRSSLSLSSPSSSSSSPTRPSAALPGDKADQRLTSSVSTRDTSKVLSVAVKLGVWLLLTNEITAETNWKLLTPAVLQFLKLKTSFPPLPPLFFIKRKFPLH